MNGNPLDHSGRWRTSHESGPLVLTEWRPLSEPAIPGSPQAAGPAVPERKIGPETGSGVFWHARDLETAACPAKLKDSGGRTPSNAMEASMSSWRRSSNRGRKTRPPTAAKRSTISASRGQGRGVVGVATLQRGGGARRWRTLLTTTTLLSQRARPRCCGRGFAWKALWDTGWRGFPTSAATTVAGRRPAWPRVGRCAAPGGGGSGGRPYCDSKVDRSARWLRMVSTAHWHQAQSQSRSEKASSRWKFSILSRTLRIRHWSFPPFRTPRKPLPIIWK